MAFCPKCGSQLTEGSAFCGSCGASTSAGSPPPPPPVTPTYDNTAYTGTGTAPNLITRVTNILTKPKEEWLVIAGESTDVAKLYTGYIIILAAIPVIASFVMTTMIMSVISFIGHVGIGHGLFTAIFTYALSLAGVYLSAFFIDKLAPSFQSQSNFLQALKLVAYASTATWVAGVFNLLPVIGLLGLLAGGIYAIYLFYLGLPVMMRTPADKVIVYMIVSAVVIFVIYFVIATVVGIFAAMVFVGSRIATGGF